MFTLKNVLIILLLVTIVWIIYLFIKTLKTSATTGSFQKKLAERKKRLENQKTREQKAQEKAELKAEIAKKRAEWKAEDEEKEAIVKAELEELIAKKKEIEPEWKRICKEYKANPEDENLAQQYQEINKKYDRLKQKIRIAKDRLSVGRKLENWSKRGGKLRRQIFINRQYYYLIAPYTFLFIIFTVVPVIMSLALSFTYFNLLEFPTFIGWDNYMNLFVNDDVWMVAIKNTAILAVVTGPLSYIMAFVFAWLINELRPLLRSFMTLVFYAPSISGNVYLVWKLIFSSDMYGYANALLIQTNIIKEPITWLQDADYIVWILIIVQLWMSLGVSFLSFIAGLQSVNKELYEAGAIDGIKNRWQELWHITLPQMKSQLLFGAVMQITSALSIADVSVNLAGFPSVEYAGHTIITHLMDYSSIRMEMGYASAIATILFLIMILANIGVRKILRRVGA
ncbi:MAG: ABC transporter permease subunit [Erysipelotrichaceae bacterium]|nr:ABC transporter permease subunit [Erysipelotrichaceae bacterium]